MNRQAQFDAERGRGFGSPVHDPRAWLDDAPSCVLPGEFALDQAAMPPFAECEPRLKGAESVLITHWPERLGRIEARMREIADATPQGARLGASIAHVLGPSKTRACFESRHSELDPLGVPSDPEHGLAIGRIVNAFADAGFVVQDVQRVQVWGGKLPRKALQSLFECGIVASRHVYEQVPERLFVRAQRVARCTMSILIATLQGEEDKAEATRRYVSERLPSRCEVIVGPAADHEAESWNRCVPESRGDRLMLMRAGDRPTPEQLAEARSAQLHAPRILTDAEGVPHHGIGGLIVARAMLFDVGPFVESIGDDVVAGEEWVLRSAACAHSVVPLISDWNGRPARPSSAVARLAAELGERWESLPDIGIALEHVEQDIAPTPWELEEREPTISLCMITRDEERFLPHCLERVRGIVDEIVIVDTGSEDSTIEIAESFGARVIEHPWRDDFAEPRNVGLAAATGDWILVLDADEVVELDSLERIRELVRARRVSGYHLHFINDFEVGRTLGVTMVRLFRNLEGLSYRFAIHEQVVQSLMEAAEPLDLVLQNSDVKVLHYGYSPSVMESRDKRTRNLRLFEKQLEKDPDDVYCLYKYADFLRMLGWPSDDVIAAFERAERGLLAMHPSRIHEVPFAGEVGALLGLELMRAGRTAEADVVLRRCAQRFLPTPNLHYMSAVAAHEMGRPDEALAQYRCLTQYHGRVLVVPIQEGSTSYIAWAGMASCYAAKGDLETAHALLLQATEQARDWSPGWLLRAGVELQRGDADLAIATLEQGAQHVDDCGPLYLQGARILAQVGRGAEARAWTERAKAAIAEQASRDAAANDQSTIAASSHERASSGQGSTDVLPSAIPETRREGGREVQPSHLPRVTTTAPGAGVLPGTPSSEQ